MLEKVSALSLQSVKWQQCIIHKLTRPGVPTMQVRPDMQEILAGAMWLRVTAESLHPLYRLFVPQGIPQEVCQCPGIAVIPDAVFVSLTHQIILPADTESLS